MRQLLLAAAVLGTIVGSCSVAVADDGCYPPDAYGRIRCLPGARPGVPYYGPSRSYDRYDRNDRYDGYDRGYYGPRRYRNYGPGGECPPGTGAYMGRCVPM